MSDFNPELVKVSKALQDCIDRLDASLFGQTDPAIIQAINREIIEISHRRTMIGSLIFAQETERIAAAATRVLDAKADIDRAIAEIEKLNKFLRAISGFLGLVDKLIDLVK